MKKGFLSLVVILALLVPTLLLAGHRTAHPSQLQDSINTPNFGYTIYYTNDDPTDTDYMSTAQAQLVANAIDPSNTSTAAGVGQHQLFLNLGLGAPFFNPSSPNEVYIYDNGGSGASFSKIEVDSVKYATAPEMDTRRTTGHELFHHVQYGYINDGAVTGCNSTWSKWTCEGTARMMQDEVYADLDADPGTTNAAYVNQINGYLTSTGNLNTTLTGLSYNAALFWKYLSEQLGSVATEPQRGVDAIVAFWQNASNTKASPDSIQVLRDTINGLQPGMTLEELWHQFAIANYAKDLDLSAIGDADKFSYIDDDATPYGSVATTSSASFSPSTAIGPTAASGQQLRRPVPRRTAQRQLQHPGLPIHRRPGRLWNDCGHRRFHRGPAGEVGDHTDFAKAFINRPSDPYTALVATVAGLGSGASYDYTFACGDARVEIVRPSTSYKAYVGEPAEPERFLVIVNVLGPAELGSPSVEGLDTSDFTVYVGAEDPANQATILSGAYVQGSYWLVAQAPVKAADGAYSLLVKLGELAQDSEDNVVQYAKIVKDQVVVIDVSGSMNAPSGNTKIEAAKNAGSLFVDAASEDDQLGAVKFSGDTIETNGDATTIHQLQTVSGQRTNAKNQIAALTTQNMTSIGDGLTKGLSELSLRGTPEGEDHIILLSDGMENEAEFWATVKTTITSSGTGTTVHSIALGPEADQALMQEIATTTGGDYLYVDLSGASSSSSASGAPATRPSSLPISAMPLPNRLADSYRIIHEAIRNHERLWESAGNVGENREVTLPITIQESRLTEPVFSFNWATSSSGATVKLLRPDGTEVLSGQPGRENIQRLNSRGLPSGPHRPAWPLESGHQDRLQQSSRLRSLTIRQEYPGSATGRLSGPEPLRSHRQGP